VNDDDIATARACTQAYAALDTEALRAVLAPDLQLRQVNPGGHLTVSSADATGGHGGGACR